MNNRNIISHIKDNWIVYAFIVQLISTFIINNADHLLFDKRITKLEDYRESETIVLTDLQTRLSAIETNILWIKERLR